MYTKFKRSNRSGSRLMNPFVTAANMEHNLDWEFRNLVILLLFSIGYCCRNLKARTPTRLVGIITVPIDRYHNSAWQSVCVTSQIIPMLSITTERNMISISVLIGSFVITALLVPASLVRLSFFPISSDYKFSNRPLCVTSCVELSLLLLLLWVGGGCDQIDT